MNAKRRAVGLLIIVSSLAVASCGGILSLNTATGEEVEVNKVDILDRFPDTDHKDNGQEVDILRSEEFNL